MSCHGVAADMNTSSRSMLHVAQDVSKTEQSGQIVAPISPSAKSFDCAKLSLDVLDCSLDAAVGVAVSDWALLVHDI